MEKITDLSGVSIMVHTEPDEDPKYRYGSLEENLMILSKYGKVRLSMYDEGWYCCVNMFVTGKGVSFEVESDFGLKSPSDATCQCKERLNTQLKKLSGITP